MGEVYVDKVLSLPGVPVQDRIAGLHLEVVVGAGEEVVGQEVQDPPVSRGEHREVQVVPGGGGTERGDKHSIYPTNN